MTYKRCKENKKEFKEFLEVQDEIFMNLLIHLEI